MGLSSSKETRKTTPVYSAQIEGTANNVTQALAAQAPKISAVTDQFATLTPGLMDRYTNGDTGVNAARAYTGDVMMGKYLGANPFMGQMLSDANDDIRNQTSAGLGTRGLAGGSAYADIVSRNIARNDTTTRYTDYAAERGRMDSAAGMQPSLASAQYLPLQALTGVAQAQQMPLQAASGAAGAVGGLLGQYTNSQSKTSPSLGMILAQMAGNAAGTYASGGF